MLSAYQKMMFELYGSKYKEAKLDQERIFQDEYLAKRESKHKEDHQRVDTK